MKTLLFNAIEVSKDRLASYEKSYEWEFKHLALLNDCTKNPEESIFKKLFSHYEGIYGNPVDWQVDMLDAYDFELQKHLDKWKAESESNLRSLRLSIDTEKYILDVLKNKNE